MQNKNQIEGELKTREELAGEVLEDFKRRQSDRRDTESRWQLNMDFLSGRQLVGLSTRGEVTECDATYPWQFTNVFNHILPVIDTRLAKLARVRPIMSVRAASDDDTDVYTARISSRVLTSTCARIDEDAVITAATRWSEVCGTVFYRVGWRSDGGAFIGEADGKKVHEGDVEVEVVSPFEIFPDDMSRGDVEECESIIRARIVSKKAIKECYGVDVNEESLTSYSFGRGKQPKSGVLLIERYERPSEEHERGRIVTVAGGEVVRVEDLPYVNGVDGARTYPFIRQVSQLLPGRFFGSSVIERLIPVQRAYNAVRNRKHEFLNRIAMGIMVCEDGSCDIDALMEDGLEPGKIIVYRQGCEPPRMMDAQSLPADFKEEEEKLIDEFVLLGGVNEVSQNYKATLGVTSAAGLEILLEQDDERLTVPAENIRRAVRETAKHIIRLFKQFTIGPRLMRTAGEGGAAEVFYFTASDVTSDDVIFETENELAASPSQRRSNVLELISSGLLSGEDGRIDPETRSKLLEILGFSGLERGRSVTTMHMARAAEENVSAYKSKPVVESYDDHAIHVLEHTRFLVGREYARFPSPDTVKQRTEEHLAEHKRLEAAAKEVEENDKKID